MRTRNLLAATGAFATLLYGCGPQDDSTAGSGDQAETMSQDGRQVGDTASGPSQQMHDLMMRPMQNMQTTGNVDRDFATMMAEHHEQAIAMSKVELEHSKNEHMREMARNMIDTQTRERERLLAIADSERASGDDKAASDSLHEIMMRPMQNMELTGDVDRDFSSLMAEHHQGAIDMAKVEIEHGKNAELKAMAQKMLEDQKKEREMLLMHAKG